MTGSAMGRLAVLFLVLAEVAGGFTLRRLGAVVELGPLGMARLWLVVLFLGCVLATRLEWPARSRLALRVGVGAALLHFVLLFSLWWSPRRPPNPDELWGVLFVMSSAPAVALLFGSERDALLRSLLQTLWVVGLFVLPVALLAFSDVGTELNLRAIGSIRIARTAGLAAVAALALAANGSGWRHLWPVPLWILVMLASGNRASVAAFAVGSVPALLAMRASKLLVGSVALAAAGAVAVVTVPLAGDIARFFALEALWDSSGRLYLADRGALYGAALEMFRSAPFVGHGFGAYAMLAGTHYEYPHNLTLGFASELGLLGLMPYFALLAAGAWAAWRSRSALHLGIASVCLFLFTSAQFTGSYGDAYLFWGSLIALMAGSDSENGEALPHTP
jgi:O-antigen ligase